LAHGTAQIIGPCRVIHLFDGAGDVPTGAAGGLWSSVGGRAERIVTSALL